MSKNELKLSRVNINNFGRIDDSRPVLLYLGDKESHIVLAEGDMKEGKSSMLEALKGALGANLKLKEQNYVNKKTGKIEVDLEFEYGGRKFRTTWRKSYFKVQEFVKDEVLDREGWVDLRSPAELIKKMIGYVADTPLYLQTLDGPKQVEEFKKVLCTDKSLAEEESQIKRGLDELIEARKVANREYTGIKKKLEVTPMYVNWEESEKKFASGPKDIDESKRELESLRIENEKYTNAVTLLTTYKADVTNQQLVISDIERQINELQVKLELAKSTLVDKEKRVKDGEAFVEKNKNISETYNQKFEAYSKIAEYNAEYTQWLSVKKDKSEMDEFETLVQQADSRKDEFKDKLRELYTKHLPEIEGLKIVSFDGIDGDTPIGVYYNDNPISILSESELWALYMKIWDAINVKFVIIDNVSSLGSGAVGMINELAKHGCYIFAAQMKRGEELSIEIIDELN